nr:hypothetical protein [Tanacetum cinerariifolium]GEZ86409.1 hypothetical protein [Tanacetum cinerariifolium]
MTITVAQQVAFDNTLVPLEKRVEIGKCNMRINTAKTQKEPTYQVVLDALALITCYPAFLITADGMFYKKNVEFFKLLWEDFTFQIENIDHKKQEKISYPRFTKAIIHHIITKDKSISMRNRMFMHTARGDSILGTMRFVSKSEDF